MPLPQCGQRETLRVQLGEEAPAVLLGVCPHVGRNKAEVQPRRRSFAHPAHAHAEGVQQPRETRESTTLQPLEFIPRDGFECSLPQAPNIAQGPPVIRQAGEVELRLPICYRGLTCDH